MKTIMKDDLLEETLSVLYLVQEELSSSAESSVNQEVEDAIQKLELMRRSNLTLSVNDHFTLMDRILRAIPAIEKLLSLLSG